MNIVRLFDVVHTDRELTLVFEFVDGDLKKVISSFFFWFSPFFSPSLVPLQNTFSKGFCII